MTEKKYKGLKIANIAGKGADGCGVQRTTAEAMIWAEKNDCTVDYYAYDKKFGRADGHNMEMKIFNMKNIKETAKYINDNYDIVMFMNYPGNKHDHDYSKAFYYELFEKIQNPIKVFYEHDIHKGQIDKTSYLVPMLVNSDLVFHFDTDTWFSKTIDELEFKKIGDRLNKYTLWMNFDELDKWRNKYLNKKKPGIVSVTRWSSLKNIRRSIDIMAEAQKLRPKWDSHVHGVERSIGAKFDIIDYERAMYVNTNGRKENEEQGEVCVYGPVTRNEGLDLVSSHMFSSSFFSLPKAPQNYGNRMEYTQIEIVGVGTIPIFDKHWAENNSLNDGRRYIDVPYSAIYTDGTNTREVAENLIEISEDKDLKEKYLETSYNLVKNEFNADIVIPKAIDFILFKGKIKEQKSVYEICDEYVNHEFAEEIKKLEDNDKLPIFGIGEFKNVEIYCLNEHKQELVKKIKRPRKNRNVKSLF